MENNNINPGINTGMAPIGAPIAEVPNWKPYLWDMWNVAAANGKDVAIGTDMFMANVREGKAIYAGADACDYPALKAKYDAAPEDVRKEAWKRLVNFRQEHYTELAALYRAKDEAGFRALCAMEVPEPEEEDGEADADC